MSESSTQGQRKSSPRWLRWGRIVIAVGLLLLLVPTLARSDFFGALARVRLPLVGLAFLLSVATVASKSYRWGLVLHARGISASNRYLLSSYFVSMFFNNFLPSGMGGDAVRAIDSARTTGKGTASVTAVILERATGMIAVFGTGSVLALFTPSIPLQIALFIHALFIGTLIAFFLFWQNFTKRLLDWVGKNITARLFGGRLMPLWNKVIGVYHDFHDYRTQWRLLGSLLLQSLITQALTTASNYTLINAFNFSPPIGGFVAVASIATAFDLVPISLNSLGVRESVYVYFLGLLSVPSGTAAAFALLIRLIVLVQALFGGVLFLWRSTHPAISPEQTVIPPVSPVEEVLP